MIDPRFIVNLKGNDYPTYPGVLDAAHRAGLLSLETEILQYPAEENGWSAVVRATATFPGPDGRERVFSDVGDCSPKNTSPQIATASIRMASTRAKGRALRDAINVGQTMVEELPDEERREGNGHSRPEAPARPAAAVSAGAHTRTERVPPVQEADGGICAWPDCEVLLSRNMRTMSVQKAGHPLCREHLNEFLQAQAEASGAGRP